MYNRDALEEKIELADVLFTACTNPKSGSFFVDPRLQRHYTVVSCEAPDDKVLHTIFCQILDQHFAKFDHTFKGIGDKVIKASAAVFNKMAKDSQLKPTAKKFHY